MHQSFSGAATRAAAHCDALLKRRAATHDMGHDVPAFGESLAAALKPVLSARQVRLLEVRAIQAGELAEVCGPLAAVSVHAFGQGDRSLLLSIEARALLAQIDRAFGGPGVFDGKLPAELPLSADLMAQRLEKQVIGAVEGEISGIEFRAGRRGSSVPQVSPFARDDELTLIELEISAEAGSPWRIVLAFETAAVPALLPRSAVSRPSGITPRKGEPGAAPFSDLPLTASATLVDMTVPLHRLAGLAPGDVLPIIVERSVPLRIGEAVIARGTVGEVDKQVALQITHTFSGKDFQ